jgi:osmotically-inducible protein OsmY
MKSDAQIQQDVMEQLKWEPELNASAIGVSVKNGIVTLSGQVDTYAKKLAAERVTKEVAGVKAVAEDIQVGISPFFRKTDTEIAEAVLNTLKWNTSVDENKVLVKVDDGAVTLEGQVEWDYQRKAARKAIENLTGVRTIYNLLSVKPAATASDIKEKISEAFRRSAFIDADKISVEVTGNKAILRGKVGSVKEKEDAELAAWSAPGIVVVDNRLEIGEEELVF